ncbi:hypothetical protein V6N13_013346 [Hibiscus sabdariffa]
MWNAQGCGHRNFIRTTRQYIWDNSPDVVGFVEPWISGTAADRIIAALQFLNSYRVEADSFSGGIWLCWYDHIRVDILYSHFQFVHCRVHCITENTSSLVTFVYASPHSSKRKFLWSSLRQLAPHISEPWAIIGDFNATLSSNERIGCVGSSKPDSDFLSTLFDTGLHDLGYYGSHFTWYRVNCVVRLARCLCNSHWLEVFSDTLVHRLLRMKSDHRPLFVTLGHPLLRHRQKLFRYFASWSKHDEFSRLLRDNWDNSLSLADNISNFSDVATHWNRLVFGSISHRKKALMARLRGVQRCLDRHRTSFLVRLEAKLQADLEQTLDQEEQLWKQKSRSDWISFGDH